MTIGITSRLGATPVILLLLLATQDSMAQRASAAAARPSCADVALTTESPELRRKMLYAIADLGYKAPDTTRLYAANLLAAFQTAFRFPNPAHFMAWGSADSVDATVAIPVVAAELMVIVRPDGQLADMAITQTSLVPAIDAAAQSAIRTALQSGTLEPPTTLGIRDDITVYIALTLEPRLGMTTSPLDVPRARTLPPPLRRVEQPIVTLALPTARFTRELEPDRNRSSRLGFPRGLLHSKVEGDATVQFVVGGDGIVVPGTVRVVGATDRGFADEAVRALKGARFFPGEIVDCPVPVLTSVRFAFRIDR